MPVLLVLLVGCLVVAAALAATTAVFVTREVHALARAQVRVGDLTEARTVLAAAAGTLRTRHPSDGGESGLHRARR